MQHITPSDFLRAAKLVVADQRAGGVHDPLEALEHVWNTLSSDALVEYDDELTEAYRVVLRVWERGGR